MNNRVSSVGMSETLLFPSQGTYSDSDELIIAVVNDTLSWIDDNLDENTRVKIITSRSGYTHWYFQRKFKEVTGITIAEYLRACRIINCTVELITTNKKILQIAMDNGFSSQQAFTRVFSNYLNFSPGVVRVRFYGKPSFIEEVKSDIFRPYPFFVNGWRSKFHNN